MEILVRFTLLLGLAIFLNSKYFFIYFNLAIFSSCDCFYKKIDQNISKTPMYISLEVYIFFLLTRRKSLNLRVLVEG